jgi:hypothetical protein
MTSFEMKVLVVTMFLAIGIAVGMLIVIALPQIRYYRRARRYMDRGGWEQLPPRDYDEENRPPRWPGG